MSMAEDASRKGTVKASENLLDVVEALLELEEAGVTEIAEAVGVSKSTVHRHLKTLNNRGYILKKANRYSLGLKFLSVGGRIREHRRISRLASEFVQGLAVETNQLAMFALKEQDHGVFTHVRNDKYSIRNEAPLGMRFGLHQNALGKAMLASLSDERIYEIINRVGLKRSTPNTVTDPDELFEQIDRIRDQGFAISRGEKTLGVYAVSASVTVDENTIGAISITGPVNRFSEQKIRGEHAERVVEAADEFELRLRYGQE